MSYQSELWDVVALRAVSEGHVLRHMQLTPLESVINDCGGGISYISDTGPGWGSSLLPESDNRCDSVGAALPEAVIEVPSGAYLTRGSSSRRRSRRASGPASSQAGRPCAAAADMHSGACTAMPMTDADPLSPEPALEVANREESSMSGTTAVAATSRSTHRRQKCFTTHGHQPNTAMGLGTEIDSTVDLAGEGDLMRATAAVAAALLPPSTLPVRIVTSRSLSRDTAASATEGPASGRAGALKPQRDASAGEAGCDNGDGENTGLLADAEGTLVASPVPEDGVGEELAAMAVAAAAAAAAAAVAKASSISVVRSRSYNGAGAASRMLYSPPGGNGSKASTSYASGYNDGATPGSPGAYPSADTAYGGLQADGAPEMYYQQPPPTAKASAGASGGADGGGGKLLAPASRRRLLRAAGVLQVAVHPREDLGNVLRRSAGPQATETGGYVLPHAGGRPGAQSLPSPPGGIPPASPNNAPPASPGTPGTGSALSPGGRRGAGRAARSPRPVGVGGAGGGLTRVDRGALSPSGPGTGASVGYAGGAASPQVAYMYSIMPPPPPPPPRRPLESPGAAGYAGEGFRLPPRSPDSAVHHHYHECQQQQSLCEMLSSPGMLAAAASQQADVSLLLSPGAPGRPARSSVSGMDGQVMQLSGSMAGGAWGCTPESPHLGLSIVRLAPAQQAPAAASAGDPVPWPGLLGTSANAAPGAMGTHCLRSAASSGTDASLDSAACSGSTSTSVGGAYGAAITTSTSWGRRASSDMAHGLPPRYPQVPDPWSPAGLKADHAALSTDGFPGQPLTSPAAAPTPGRVSSAGTPPYSPRVDPNARLVSTTAATNPFATRLPQGPIVATAATGDPTLDVISAVNWSVDPCGGTSARSSSAIVASPPLRAPSPGAAAAVVSASIAPSLSRTNSNAVPGSSDLMALRTASYPATPRPPTPRSLTAVTALSPPSAAAYAGAPVNANWEVGAGAQGRPGIESLQVSLQAVQRCDDVGSSEVVAALAAARQLMPGIMPGALPSAAACPSYATTASQMQLVPLAYLLQRPTNLPDSRNAVGIAGAGGSECWQWQNPSNDGGR